jgi:hypothetical protein
MSETFISAPQDELASLEDNAGKTIRIIATELAAGSIDDKKPEVPVAEIDERRERVKEAIERSRRRVPLKAAPERNKTAAERIEDEVNERIKQAIRAEFGNAVNNLLVNLDAKGRLQQGAETTFEINNKKLLELLRENGYISQDMMEAGQLGLAALTAAQLLASKGISNNAKRHLLGPSSNLARDVFNEEIGGYFFKNLRSKNIESS